MSEEKVYKSRPMRTDYYHPENNPHGKLFAPVNIIIPYHGNYNGITKLLTSIFETVRKNNYQINLIDDCSPNKKYGESLKKVDGLLLTRNDMQKGFAYCINTAIKKSIFPLVCVLQSDVVVSGDWLSQMIQTLNENESSMVSALTNNPLSTNPNIKANKNEFKNNYILNDEPLSLHCFLTRTELFEKIGYFKESEFYIENKDIEFFQKMQLNNSKQVVCGKAWVEHKGRGTFERYDKNKKIQKLINNT